MADESDVVILKPPGNDDNQDQPEEEIVAIEDLHEDQKEEEQAEELGNPDKKNKKKLFIIIGCAVAFVLILVILLIVLLKKPEKITQPNNLTQTIEQNYKTQNFSAGKIDDMIRKANELYERGNKFEALKIYENISNYNQSLSNYNLGVSQMKQERYAESLNSFKKAIKDGENMTSSAINAAVSALELNNTIEFDYYLGIANSFLKNESKNPLYSYYYALIHYYKGEYLKALQALEHPSSKDYSEKYNYLTAKILSALGKEEEASLYLESAKSYRPYLTLAQLYANQAKYQKARDYLQKAAQDGLNMDEISMSEALIDLKTGQYQNAATILKQLFKENPETIEKLYPIKPKLNDELFDINLAQSKFKNDIFHTQKAKYETLFYFAPYKVFNAKQTINLIRKGGANLFLDDTNNADSYLNASKILSKVNAELANAIHDALNFELRKANKKLLELISLYPEHSILRYNLALSFAQLGDFAEAARHFIASYHLAPRDYLAGVLGVLASELSGGANPKFISEITENMQSDQNLSTPNLYTAILALTTSNQAALSRWLDEQKPKTALNLAFDTIISKIINQNETAKQKAIQLKELLPDDIMANIIDFIVNHDSNNIKTYAKNIQIAFNNNKLKQDSFYHGSAIIKKQYIKLLQISGLLNSERNKVLTALKNAPNNQNYIQTLAYIDIYTKNFKEAYELYNKIIDEFKITDASTLFLASVAATGAQKPANAIALLELSKLSNSGAPEPRAALGYLYQSIGNIDAAIIQYNKIGNNAPKNEFYDFELNHEN